MNPSQPVEPSIPSTPLPPPVSTNGRWKWGAAILAVALVAQSILWTIWWEDPTYFKMSVLFVWPAALFALLIWWTFFSGWSRGVRFGSVASLIALVIGFLSLYRLEWDGAMVPRRIVLRSKPSGVEIARQYLKERANSTPEPVSPDAALAVEESPLVVAEGDWPGFRGPLRDGIVHGGDLRQDWNTHPLREIWRHPLGRAWSSFAVIGDFAFTQEQRDEYECVVAYDLNTGKQRWVHQDQTILSIVDANGGPGPHATPQFHEGSLYSLGGTGLLNCLDARTGKSLWSTNILTDAGDGKVPAANIEWGMSCSPLIVDNLVIVIPGGTNDKSAVGFDKGVAAYDKSTGQLVWSHGQHPSSYGSPRVETIAGSRQLLIPNANGLSGHAVEGGQELWFFPLENPPKVNSTMPWLLDDHSLFFGTGYGVGSVRLNLTFQDGVWDVKPKWQTNRFRPKFNDFVVLDGHAYGLDDGTLACMDVETGKIKWKSGRYGYGQLLLVDDHLLVISEDGELLLIAAQPTRPEVKASMKLMESGFCWNHPVLVHGKLLVRNAVEVVCLEVGQIRAGD